MKLSFVVVLLNEVGKVLCDLFEGYGLSLLDLLRIHKAFRLWRKDCRGMFLFLSDAAARRGVSLRETYSCSH